jgi:formiminotetrahydrofolate cyclodeaminase
VLDKTTTIEKFLESAAAKQPTPGGGSVAALAGALAAAMGEMAVNYSIGKKGLEEYSEKLQGALAEFHKNRNMLLKWMEVDQIAYERLSEARKLPESDPERQRKISEGTLSCIHAPLAVMKITAELIRVTYEIVEMVNSYLLSDLAVCAELAMATTRTAIYNVRVNLPAVEETERRKIQEECDIAMKRALLLIKRAMPRIWERVLEG